PWRAPGRAPSSRPSCVRPSCARPYQLSTMRSRCGMASTMPRTAGLSGRTTRCRIFRNPSDLSTRLCVKLHPMPLPYCSMVMVFAEAARAARAGFFAAFFFAVFTAPVSGIGGHLAGRRLVAGHSLAASPLGDRILELEQAVERRLDDVVRV